MRLLNAQNLQLKSFHEHEIPSYVILSHTWGNEEDEVTLQDMLDGSAPDKIGYKKIVECCQEAQNWFLSDFAWVWVDTCCIDKTSSAELSEAINSMFRWYGKAGVCFAYLEDFEEPSGPHPGEFSFFGPGWVLIGTRASLFQEIARITGIDENVLNGSGDPKAFSIAQRLSWASKRVTTREEDIAYCLLGILGVNMPLIYGEGSHAFIRLQEEIIKDSVDQSLFAWERVPDEGAEFYPDLYRGILARAPLEFKNAARIVHHPDPGEPYTMTNKGLRIQLAVKRRRDGCLCAVLNCHFENDLAGPIGTILKPNRDNTLYGTSLFFHAGESPLVMSHKEATSAQSFVFYLSKYDEIYTGSRRSHQKCWLRQLPAGFELAEAIFAPVQAVPQEISREMLWDLKRRTMDLPFRLSYAAALRLEGSAREEVIFTVQVNDPYVGEVVIGNLQPQPKHEALLRSLQRYSHEKEKEKEKERDCEKRRVPYQSPYQSSRQNTIRDKNFTARISKDRIFGIDTLYLMFLRPRTRKHRRWNLLNNFPGSFNLASEKIQRPLSGPSIPASKGRRDRSLTARISA